MLEPDPGHRLPTVAAVRDAIASDEDGQPAKTTRQAAPSPGPAPHAGPAEEGADEEDPSPLADVSGPLAVVLRVFGMAGYVGLTVLDAVILPLVFVMLGAAWSARPDKVRQLKEKKRSVRRMLREGRRSMKALGRGHDPYNRLEGWRPPPALPPRGRHGRDRPRGRHGRRRRRG